MIAEASMWMPDACHLPGQISVPLANDDISASRNNLINWWPVIDSSNKYLLSVYYVLGTKPGPWDAEKTIQGTGIVKEINNEYVYE